MALKFDDLFHCAFESKKPSKTADSATEASSGRRHLFYYSVGQHDTPVLNRVVAAHWASRKLPSMAVDLWFAASGLEKRKDLLSALLLSASTLSRAKPDTTLDATVTERMLRQSELFVRAAEVFGQDGATWMTKPHDLLNGKSPLEYASNEFGGAKVRQILNAIEYGGVV
jgi:putative toxin-antitoxin system antitoxin component (TIGR02293 family)